ncbi:tyrosine-type recombinase/integrase [Paenibacillus sp. FSL R10-2736]|uniref:tyrosine-type recombinase/integrase n=1 Tax=Paenibacillus sp. FSL R10-2736 TaxID=2954692 RepID=UPI0030F5F176
MAKKRANGEGSVYKVKRTGGWGGKLQIGVKSNGTPDYKYVYGKTQGEVLNKLNALRKDSRNGVYVHPDKVTLGEWLDNWLNVTVKLSLRDTTWLLYESLVRNHIKEVLGKIQLSKLKAANVQKFYNEKLTQGRKDGKEGGLSAQTIRHFHKVLNSALDQAVAEKFLSENIMSAVKQPKLLHKEMQILNKDQIRQFLETLKAHKDYQKYYPMFLLELYSGLRRGELLALRFKDILVNQSAIKIVQQVVKVGGKNVVREIKTTAGQSRKIVIPTEILNILILIKHSRIDQFKSLGVENELHGLEEQYIFSNSLGGYIKPRNFVRIFKAILKAAELPLSIRFHDLRHTFATTISLEQGIDIKTLQADLGHNDISTTLNRYGHVTNEMQLTAAVKRKAMFDSLSSIAL